MKIWRFYYKEDVETEYNLYAITNNKKNAAQFMQERNMDKFIVRCTSEDSETFTKLVHDNRDCYLQINKFITKSVLKNGLISHKEVGLLTTEYEFQSCNGGEYNNDVMSEEFWKDAPSYMLYKRKIKNALNVIDYITNHKLFTVPDLTLIDPSNDDFSAPDLWIDEVGVLIRIFDRTFK